MANVCGIGAFVDAAASVSAPAGSGRGGRPRCAGAGASRRAARLVADALAEGGQRVEVILTDRFPNPKAFADAGEGSDGRVSGREESVDATAVPADLVGFRTIFNAFHHFPPELARRILADAVAKRQPIAVFEAVSREPLMLLALMFSPLSVTLTMPLWRPFRWPWLLFTWIFPVMQPFVLWDGVVSWLRIYSVEELRELVTTIDAPDWEWDIGTLQHNGAPLHATYLIGKPKPRHQDAGRVEKPAR